MHDASWQQPLCLDCAQRGMDFLQDLVCKSQDAGSCLRLLVVVLSMQAMQERLLALRKELSADYKLRLDSVEVEWSSRTQARVAELEATHALKLQQVTEPSDVLPPAVALLPARHGCQSQHVATGQPHFPLLRCQWC